MLLTNDTIKYIIKLFPFLEGVLLLPEWGNAHLVQTRHDRPIPYKNGTITVFEFIVLSDGSVRKSEQVVKYPRDSTIMTEDQVNIASPQDIATADGSYVLIKCNNMHRGVTYFLSRNCDLDWTKGLRKNPKPLDEKTYKILTMRCMKQGAPLLGLKDLLQSMPPHYDGYQESTVQVLPLEHLPERVMHETHTGCDDTASRLYAVYGDGTVINLFCREDGSYLPWQDLPDHHNANYIVVHTVPRGDRASDYNQGSWTLQVYPLSPPPAQKIINDLRVKEMQEKQIELQKSLAEVTGKLVALEELGVD